MMLQSLLSNWSTGFNSRSTGVERCAMPASWMPISDECCFSGALALAHAPAYPPAHAVVYGRALAHAPPHGHAPAHGLDPPGTCIFCSDHRRRSTRDNHSSDLVCHREVRHIP